MLLAQVVLVFVVVVVAVVAVVTTIVVTVVIAAMVAAIRGDDAARQGKQHRRADGGPEHRHVTRFPRILSPWPKLEPPRAVKGCRGCEKFPLAPRKACGQTAQT